MDCYKDMVDRLIRGHVAERPLLLNGRPMSRLQRYDLLDMLAIEKARKTARRINALRCAISGYFRQQSSGTQITFKASGGSAAITLASLANSTSDSTGARQSVKADFQTLGSGTNTSATIYLIKGTFKWLTTAPTTQTLIDVFINASSSGTAGTDNMGGCDGTDAAYTGVTNDISVAVGRLLYGGSFEVSALADADQIGFIGFYQPVQRYNGTVVWNKSGRLLHSTEGNQGLAFQPIEQTSDAS